MTNSLPAPTPNEELDLGELLASLWRQKVWLLAGGAIGLLAAAVYNAKTPPLWQGSFEVVIAKQNGGGITAQLGTNSMLAGLAGLGLSGGNSGSELETQLKILQSPSVLNPVFEQVKSLKQLRGVSTDRLNLAGWSRNLNVQLAKGTSIVTITYQDSDKGLVVPVLQRISKAYQSYSGQERRESLQNGIQYATQQVIRLRSQAAASSREADTFRIRHGIAATSGTIAGGAFDLSNLISQNRSSGPQNPAVSVQSGGSGQLQSMGEPLSQLAAINQELVRRQQIFTDRDPSVIALQRERDALRRYINISAGGALATPSPMKLTQQQAQDLVLRYQELERKAKRDTSTLDSLENALLSLQLEQARASQPWDMISNPALLDRPVGPRSSRNLAVGLLAGLVSGAALGLVAERRRGRVFNRDELTCLLPYPLLTELAPDPNSWTPTLQLLADGPLLRTSSLALIPAGDLQNAAESLQSALSPLLPNNTRLEVCSDLHQARSFDQQLLVASLGAASRHELEQLQRSLLLQGNPVLGLVLV